MQDTSALGPPSDRAFTTHGGALDAARRLYPEAPEPWIDLSTGINPRAYPVGDLALEAWRALPEAGALAALEAEAARCHGAAAAARVVAAPGTQAIIQRLPALLGGRDTRVLGPATYGEFARVFAAAGIPTRVVDAIDALAGADVAIVVNPNNPDGRLVSPGVLARLAARVGALVVDEAFMDALGTEASIVPLLPRGRAVALRSFGKFYGLAGLRLGFAVAPDDLARDLGAMLGPWAVAGPALAIGRRALADADWSKATRRILRLDAARLDALLERGGMSVVGGTPLFRLARHRDARALFETLARAGILVRPFADAPDWLRFGPPDGEAAWSRLADALAAFAPTASRAAGA